MNRNYQRLSDKIERWVSRKPEREIVRDMLAAEGVSAVSQAMLDIVKMDYDPEWVNLHIRVFSVEGRPYGAGGLINRIRSGWEPNVHKLGSHEEAINELNEELREEEADMGRSLTGKEILNIFISYRKHCTDYFDQLVSMRGDVTESEIRHVESLTGKYADVVQR